MHIEILHPSPPVKKKVSGSGLFFFTLSPAYYIFDVIFHFFKNLFRNRYRFGIGIVKIQTIPNPTGALQVVASLHSSRIFDLNWTLRRCQDSTVRLEVESGSFHWSIKYLTVGDHPWASDLLIDGKVLYQLNLNTFFVPT